MIPKTPEECDAFIADVSARILAAIAAQAHAELTTLQMSPAIALDKRLRRSQFACEEAGALLAELQLHARVQRFDDGTPIDPRAADPKALTCAHGVALSDPCAECSLDSTEINEALAHGMNSAADDLSALEKFDAEGKLGGAGDSGIATPPEGGTQDDLQGGAQS